MAEHEERKAPMMGLSVWTGEACGGRLNKAPRGIHANPPAVGPRPVPPRPPRGATGETLRGSDSGSAIKIKIDVDADEAIKKLKSIQREARKAAQALRGLGEAAGTHVTVEVKSPQVDGTAVARAVQEAYRTGRPSDVLKKPALTSPVLSKTGAKKPETSME